MGSDQWGHDAFQPHNADQSRSQPAPAAHACWVNVSARGGGCCADDAL